MVTNGESQDKLKWAFQLYDKGMSSPPPINQRLPPIQASRRALQRIALYCPIAACALALTTVPHVCLCVVGGGHLRDVWRWCGRDAQMATACWTEMRWWT